ncbi:hypothetical protein, partial [Desulfosarcina cetonica]|uniref:hypothetical protein n=1 Tax=Desulfosarcina cetonica TaxID=90730 RepID=UPI001C46C86B
RLLHNRFVLFFFSGRAYLFVLTGHSLSFSLKARCTNKALNFDGGYGGILVDRAISNFLFPLIVSGRLTAAS